MPNYYNTLKSNPYIITVEELSLNQEVIDKLILFPNGKLYTSEAENNIEKISYFRIIYRSQGHKVVGFIIQPNVTESLPCIIYNRGGSGNFSKIESEKIFTNKYSKYATWGYVTIMSQYSGNDGGDGLDQIGGTEINDVLILRDILTKYPFADVSRIGMYGTSRGGTMTYLALSKVSWIRAAAVKSAMADRFRSFRLRPKIKERARQFFNVNDDQELTKRSAVYWVDKFCKTTPVLLLHGTADDLVSPLDSLDISRLLLENGLPFSLMLFNRGDHTLSQYADEENLIVQKWFDKYVK